MSAADSFLRSGPTVGQIEYWNDIIHKFLYENSTFLKLMNTDHPDSRRTASEINEINRRTKSEPIGNRIIQEALNDAVNKVLVDAFPGALELIDVKRQLECVTKQRDEYIEHADRSMVRIRRLEAEIADLKEFQTKIQLEDILACVDGKYYTVEDLCKEFSALKELHRSHTEAFEKGAANQNAMIQTLHKEVDNLRGMNDTLEKNRTRLGDMSKFEYQIVTIESPEAGPKLLLATFDTKDWGGHEGAESAARSMAKQMMEFRPGVRLEIEVVFTKSEVTRTIRL